MQQCGTSISQLVCLMPGESIYSCSQNLDNFCGNCPCLPLLFLPASRSLRSARGKARLFGSSHTSRPQHRGGIIAVLLVTLIDMGLPPAPVQFGSAVSGNWRRRLACLRAPGRFPCVRSFTQPRTPALMRVTEQQRHWATASDNASADGGMLPELSGKD